MSWSDGWKTTSGSQSFQSSISSSRISCRCSGNVRHVEVVNGQVRGRDAELGGRVGDLVPQRVRWESLRQRARRDRERDVADLGTLLDEPRHRAAAAELTVVCVGREHERALPAADHARLRLAHGDTPTGRAAPRRADPRRARCRRGCARRSRSRLVRRQDGRGRSESRPGCAGTARQNDDRDQPGEQREAGQPGLGGDGDRRVVRGRAFGSLPLQMGLLRIGVARSRRCRRRSAGDGWRS